MKKTLSIILAILMIVTTIPFALAAEEAPDFSDAKVLSSDADGYLCIDGVRIDIYLTNVFYEERQAIPSGKYKLEGDILSNACPVSIKGGENVVLNLNGYDWIFEGQYSLLLNGELSLYDLSEDETGKFVAESSWGNVNMQDEDAVFNLYSGTLESTGGLALRLLMGAVNLYGGKLKSNKYTISYCVDMETNGINIDDAVIESGDGYEQISCYDGNGDSENSIDVSDYTGDGLAVKFNVTKRPGKYTIFEGLKNAEEAEKYSINVTCNENYEVFLDKTEYDEAKGDMNVYIAKNAFTQQPSAENNFTVDFNNPAATFQWYEVEENHIGAYTAEEKVSLFRYDVKAGDILKVSTDSEIELVVLDASRDYLELDENTKTAMVKFDTDKTVDIRPMIVRAENPVELEFSIIRETALYGETDKTLQNPGCGKNYWCKATVGRFVYTSDTVVGHDIIQVEEKAPTCTETGRVYMYCTACDFTTYVEIPVDPENHSAEITKVDAKAPTCTEIGWDAYEYCPACTYTTKVEIPVNPDAHDIIIDKAVAGDCTNTGLTEGSHCSRCDYKVEQEVIPATGEHIDADGDKMCDNGGEQLTCEDCGRPVHEDTLVQNFICWLVMLVNIIKSMF